MTVEEIEKAAQVQAIIHTTARRIRETLNAATAEIAKIGDEEDAETKILELVTEES